MMFLGEPMILNLPDVDLLRLHSKTMVSGLAFGSTIIWTKMQTHSFIDLKRLSTV